MATITNQPEPMESYQYKAIAKSALKTHALNDWWPIEEWEVEFNDDINKILGRARCHSRVIELSSEAFIENEDKISKETLIDIVLHEVAHALDFEDRGTSGHDEAWKDWARRVGADPTRETSLPEEAVKAMANWKRECPECGWTSHYSGKPRKEEAYCPDCHESKNKSVKLEILRAN